MVKSPIMRNALLLILLLTGTALFAQAPQATPAEGNEGQPVTETPEKWIHERAEENTAFFMRRYQIEEAEKKGQIYQAYKKYLLAEQQHRSQAGKPSANSMQVRALEDLKTELARIAGKEVDPSLPL